MTVQPPRPPRKAAARPRARPASAGAGKADKPRQADELIALTCAAQFFHDAATQDAYASFTTGAGDQRCRETWPVQSKRFRHWLCKLFLDAHGTVPAANAVRDAIHALDGQAVLAGRALAVAVRLAATTETDEGGANPRRCIWLDLADDAWQVVCIGPGGWSVLGPCSCPVRFVRPAGMLPLPVPVRGGRLDALRDLLNLTDEGQWLLLAGWLLGALHPGQPCPALAVNGEQGSGKSTLCRIARALLDPNTADLNRPPRNEDDLLIAARHSWVIGFDNLSEIRRDLSDALCRLVTGAAARKRTLYTDADETLFAARRPLVLNGIEDVVSNGDLLDRCIRLTLAAIGDARRRTEADLWPRFYEARPRLLGSLLDALSAALYRLPATPPPRDVRMADFAHLVTAAEEHLGWQPGAFLKAYQHNRGQAHALALESSLLTESLRDLRDLMQGRTHYHGRMKELLAELNARVDEQTRKDPDWPKRPRGLSGQLRRLAPSLRDAGLLVTFHKHTPTGTPVTLERRRAPSTPSAPSAAPPVKDLRPDDTPAGAGQPSAPPSARNPLPGKTPDGADGPDDACGPSAHGEEPEHYDPHT
jgi:hypothetical protein